MALTTPGYAAQSFDQDAWMARESTTSGHDALDAFLGMAAMNIALFASLSGADRAIALSHPEYGSLTVDWIIHQMAGHQIHHLEAARSDRAGQVGQVAVERQTWTRTKQAGWDEPNPPVVVLPTCLTRPARPTRSEGPRPR